MKGDATKLRAIATAQYAFRRLGSAINYRHACVVLVAMLLEHLRREHNVSEAQALLEARQYTAAAHEAQAERRVA